MKIPVAVFDSSNINIPNPPAIKFSSFEGQPLTAWKPSAQHNNRVTNHRATPSGERPSSKQTNGHSTPREKSVDMSLDGRASPQSQHKRTLASPKKWAEPSLDKRSKTILDVLQSKRVSKQSESRNLDLPDGAKGSGSLRGSVNGVLIKDKVIKYPKFVVREKKKREKSSDHKIQSKNESQVLVRSQSLRYNNNREHHYISGTDTMANSSNIYRDIDARRSYRPHRTARASLYDQSGTPTCSTKTRPVYTNRDTHALDENSNQDVDDFIMGFFPDEMQDYFQARSMNPNIRPDSTNLQKSRSGSPPYEQIPPPPTPASQLLMQLGVDANDPERVEEELRYELRLQQERRKSMREKIRNRDKSCTGTRDQSDPGVSNTTQHLIESNVIRRNFVFPNLFPDAHRKSLATPRSDDKNYMYRMSPAPFGRIKGIFNGGNINSVQFAVAPVVSYDMNDSIDNTREKSSSKIDLSQSHDQLATPDAQRSQSSIGITSGITRSHSFYHGQKRPDKYARMISLGLPKVNIDIDKNHFSQGGIVRRSIEIREKYQIPDHIKDVKVGEQDNSKYMRKYAQTGDVEMVSDDRKSSSSHKTSGRVGSSGKGSGDGEQMRLPLNADIVMDPDDIENNGPQCSSHIKFIPPPNTPIDVEQNVFQRRSTVRKKSSKILVKGKAQMIDYTKGAVGVSYFKMLNPGEKTETKKTKHMDKPSDAQIYAYGVTLSANEIAL